MNIIEKLLGIFKKKHSDSAPLLIIKKDAENVNVKEYKSIEEAIEDLENDPNVPAHKIKKLKESLKKLKNRNSITIRDGEIIK